MSKIQKILSVGDTVYSASNCHPMKVTRIYSTGFDTEEDYFSFDEHRELYWLIQYGYQYSTEKEGDQNDR